MVGHIKKLVRDKGFGFIRDPEGVEYFFHRSAVDRGSSASYDTLIEGDQVEFEEEDGGSKGPRANRVVRA